MITESFLMTGSESCLIQCSCHLNPQIYVGQALSPSPVFLGFNFSKKIQAGRSKDDQEDDLTAGRTLE